MQDIFHATRRGRIHCRVVGDGAPLFLMHSNGRSAYEYDALARRLAHRFKVTAWDMPGQGDSDRHSAHMSVRDYAELALDVASRGGGKPILGGSSIGAVVALAAAAYFPDDIAGLIAIELPLTRGSAWWEAAWPNVEALFSIPDESIEAVRARFREVSPEFALRLRIDRHKAEGWAMMSVLWAGRDDADAIQDRIRALKVPGLFINGDAGVAQDAPLLLPALNPAANLVAIANSKHFPQTDDPDRVAEAILARFAP